MSKGKALEILTRLAENDSSNVKEYNDSVSWSGYSIERHLIFISHRLTYVTGSVCAAIRELAEQEPPSGSGKHE